MNTTAWSIKNGWALLPDTCRDRQIDARTACSIMPGMVCSVDIKTGRGTILSYLLKPINKARQGAMSER
jgi:adhesin transport system membrane fusion protein